MDTEEILAKQVEQLERDKREMQEKLRGQEKKASRVTFDISRVQTSH